MAALPLPCRPCRVVHAAVALSCTVPWKSCRAVPPSHSHPPPISSPTLAGHGSRSAVAAMPSTMTSPRIRVLRYPAHRPHRRPHLPKPDQQSSASSPSHSPARTAQSYPDLVARSPAACPSSSSAPFPLAPFPSSSPERTWPLPRPFLSQTPSGSFLVLPSLAFCFLRGTWAGHVSTPCMPFEPVLMSWGGHAGRNARETPLASWRREVSV